MAAAYFVNADALYVSLKSEGVVGQTIPNKLMMSMAFGKPIIGVLKGDGRKVLQESGGTLLADENADLHTAQIRDLVSLINTDSRQLLDFIGQLLELSNFEGSMPSYTLIEVNLAELMASYRREALNFTKPDVAVRVTTDLSPHCRGILDTNLMHQLMMHLLHNAANHVAEGDIFIRYDCERRGLKVTVSYTGIGLAELAKEDFFAILQKDDSLKDAGKSSRFGIAICRAIVDMLGGEFYLDSGADKKNVASFWFPCTMKDIYKDL
jgi:K+-sensing histidine kinase KdpD